MLKLYFMFYISDISGFLLLLTRAEVLGCAEGKVEGEVKLAKERFSNSNRFRLKVENFAMEY